MNQVSPLAQLTRRRRVRDVWRSLVKIQPALIVLRGDVVASESLLLRTSLQFSVTWYDAVDDQHVIKVPQNVTGGSIVKLQPPSTTNHWIGLLLS